MSSPTPKTRSSSFGRFSLTRSRSSTDANRTRNKDDQENASEGAKRRGGLGASLRKLKDSSGSLTRSLSARVPKVPGRNKRSLSVQLPKAPPVIRVKSEPRPRDNGVAGLPTVPDSRPTRHRYHLSDATGGPTSLHTIPQSPHTAQDPSAAFISHPPGQTPPYAMSDILIPDMLRQGTPMVKVSAKKQKRVILKLDPEQGQLSYETSKLRYIPIESIKEIRTGADACYYREQFQLSIQYEDRWLTIVYILDGKYKTLHVVSATRDVLHLWNVTLEKLHGIRKELMSGLGNDEVREAVWERQYWKSADLQADQKLEFDEVEKLCRRLNINSGRDDLRRLFKQADTQNRGYLDFADFQRFVKMLKARPELDRIYKRWKLDNKGIFGYEAFERFMKDVQKSTLGRPELEKIFLKYATDPNAAVPASPPASPTFSTIGLPHVDDPFAAASAPQPLAMPPEAIVPSLSQPSDSPSNVPPLPPQAEPHVPEEAESAPALQTHRSSVSVGKDNSSATDAAVTASPAPILADASSSCPSTDACSRPGGSSATDTHQRAAVPTSSSTSPDELSFYTISLSAFTAFLLSSDNSPFPDAESTTSITHDMTRPLPEYYISSSHNTYLVGHQLVGDSTIEGYIRALLHGCRSVELDIYDGEIEPCVFHGKTLTSKVAVRDICRAISKYAFVASPYPIIISAEIHCGVAQQEMLVKIMQEEFGDALISAPPDNRPVITVLPSPEDLKGRVLLKAKNLYVSSREGLTEKEVVVNTESSSTENSSASDSEPLRAEIKGAVHELKSDIRGEMSKARNIMSRVRHRKSPSITARSPSRSPALQSIGLPPTPPAAGASSSSGSTPKIKMSMALVELLVYTVGVKCRGINKKEQYAPEHVFSLSESTANKVMKQGMMDLIKHNRTHIVRIYPKGTRLNSTNYEPHRYWSAGCQLVAINWQTFDLGYMINHSMFQRNGRCGYVLKPRALREPSKDLLSRRTQHYLDISIISAQQLPRPKDANGREIVSKSMVDPLVEVSIHVPDWTHSPFVPTTDTKYSPPNTPMSAAAAATATTARTVSYKTGRVKNNGFNPVWEESFSLPFDCVGNMKELVFVKFAVKDDDDRENTESLALYCASLGCLNQGYRHLPLHDAQLSQYLFSTLFVHIGIREV
ncbi:PLC-like phosphodiesterase [Punctularia strigosozonata HHB-11173 SS5]|uniref:PLC-like phosphodiesterase n=1 Tax=Punctularia strigosozonata (strain HHB-11173) TaxID=741275 RepID=UPI00044180B5|nr:PLC-like phosphodiesterase [Punctularia strigosozonata HHB-11173 SS5]EIN14625.1 PLC-like phosphodiesterase [Punctularia strigosozonata HHB-11173 SS5]